MKVEDSEHISEGYSIEWGQSSWNENDRSIRNRYKTSSGGFSPRSSSEMPIGDLEHLVVESAKRDYLEPEVAARMIEALAGSLGRQVGNTEG